MATETNTTAASAEAVGIDRDTPQALIDLAITAIKRGASGVAIDFESLDSDFHAPVGWLLQIIEVGETGGHSFGPDVASHLLRHRIGADLAELDLPASLADEQLSDPVVDELIELFEAGIKNGWQVYYQRANGSARHTLHAKALHWFYDDDARFRREARSIEVMLSMPLQGSVASEPVAFTNYGGDQRRINLIDVDTLLKTEAPHSAPVAYFDPERAEWVK